MPFATGAFDSGTGALCKLILSVTQAHTPLRNASHLRPATISYDRLPRTSTNGTSLYWRLTLKNSAWYLEASIFSSPLGFSGPAPQPGASMFRPVHPTLRVRNSFFSTHTIKAGGFGHPFAAGQVVILVCDSYVARMSPTSDYRKLLEHFVVHKVPESTTQRPWLTVRLVTPLDFLVALGIQPIQRDIKIVRN